MEVTEKQIAAIVENVLKNWPVEGSRPARPSESPGEGIFETVDQAVEAADHAFGAYRRFGLQERKTVIDAVRAAGMAHREELSRMVLDETGMGRYEDKLLKHRYAALLTPGTEDLETRAWSGKNGLALEEYAPFGVIGSVTPSTHPSETIINNTIMMLAAGNTVVFNPHPSAKKVSAFTVRLCNEAMKKAGAPSDLIATVASPGIETARQLFEHPKISLLSITGGPGVVQAALKSNKKVIAAGPGNPPVLIDETADLALAAHTITRSAGFDNNILCFAEKEIFVVGSVFDGFMKEMEKQGNVRLTGPQIDRLAQNVFEKKRSLTLLKKEFVGRDACVLAGSIGLKLTREVMLLFGETARDHEFVREEQMMPFLPVVRVHDFIEGLEAAKEAEHGYRHSASVFTRDIGRATAFARETDCAIVVINGGTYQGDGGEDGEGSLSFTIASPTGEGITKPHHFARVRRIMTSGALRFV